MINFLIYVFIGAVAGWLFKIAAGLLESVLILLPFGATPEKMQQRIEARPRLFFTVLTFKNVIISLINATMIFMLTAYFLQRWGGNLWLYIILSVIWSLHLITINAAFPMLTLFTSTGTLILYWLSFGPFAWMITGILGFSVSLAYQLARVNVIREQGAYERYI